MDPNPNTDPDADRDTGRTYLGGGMYRPIASSYFMPSLESLVILAICIDYCRPF